MKIAAATTSLVLALAGSASAQPGMTDPEEPPPAPAPRPAPSGGELSESTALALSVGGTIGSWALVIGAAKIEGSDGDTASMLGTAGALGVMFGPSFGHWYAGKFATRGLGLRALGIATAFAGAMVAFSQCPLFAEDEEGGCDDTGGAMIALAGVGLFIAGTIDDIATAPGRVRKRNARLAGLAVAPVVTQHSAGFALGGRF
jgi:hypothetical protein